jgi:hypothetical protein
MDNFLADSMDTMTHMAEMLMCLEISRHLGDDALTEFMGKVSRDKIEAWIKRVGVFQYMIVDYTDLKDYDVPQQHLAKFLPLLQAEAQKRGLKPS